MRFVVFGAGAVGGVVGGVVGARLHQAGRGRSFLPDVMGLKYAKLILNLSNAVNALCAADERREELAVGAQDEGRAALDAAGMATEQARGHAAPGELSVDDVLAAVGA